MTADSCLLIRDAGTWDIPALAALLSRALAVHPLAALQSHDAVRARGRDLLAERVAAGTVRLAEDDGQPVAVLAWTGCPANTGPGGWLDAALLGLPAGSHLGPRAVLAGRHPRQAHQHLLVVAVHPDRQGHDIDGALLNDWHHHSSDPPARFLLGYRTLAAAARAAGYRSIGGPIGSVYGAPPLHALWHTGHPAGTDTMTVDTVHPGDGRS